MSRSWKDISKKERKARRYGKRDTSKYDTPFMMLDEQMFGKEEEV